MGWNGLFVYDVLICSQEVNFCVCDDWISSGVCDQLLYWLTNNLGIGANLILGCVLFDSINVAYHKKSMKWIEFQVHLGLVQALLHKPSIRVLEICYMLQRVTNSSPSSGAYMRQWTWSPLVKIMACHLFGAKPLPEPMLSYCQLYSWETEIWIEILSFSFKKIHLKMLSANIAVIIAVIFVQGKWVNCQLEKPDLDVKLIQTLCIL